MLFEGKDSEKSSTDEGSCKCHPYDLIVEKCTKYQAQILPAEVTVIQEEKHHFKGDMGGINREDPILLALN